MSFHKYSSWAPHKESGALKDQQSDFLSTSLRAGNIYLYVYIYIYIYTVRSHEGNWICRENAFTLSWLRPGDTGNPHPYHILLYFPKSRVCMVITMGMIPDPWWLLKPVRKLGDLAGTGHGRVIDCPDSLTVEAAELLPRDVLWNNVIYQHRHCCWFLRTELLCSYVTLKGSQDTARIIDAFSVHSYSNVSFISCNENQIKMTFPHSV